jgi:hypothetical protein
MFLIAMTLWLQGIFAKPAVRCTALTHRRLAENPWFNAAAALVALACLLLF